MGGSSVCGEGVWLVCGEGVWCVGVVCVLMCLVSGECSISCLVYSSRMVFYEYLRDHVFGKNKDGSFDIW